MLFTPPPSQLKLSFYEKRRRQSGWFMLQQDERLYWEQWCAREGGGGLSWRSFNY